MGLFNLPTSGALTSEESARNAGRAKSDGLCGWVALELASRAGDFPDSGLDPGVPEDRARLAEFMIYVAGLASGAALAKAQRVSTHLLEEPCRILPRSSGMWLGVEDVLDLHLPFELVVWGSDTGDGWRRVLYPLAWNMGVNELDARSIMGCNAQIVLDCDHFFPVDTVISITIRIGNRQRSEPFINN